jgi:predicted MFS family arabinose efflux permease
MEGGPCEAEGQPQSRRGTVDAELSAHAYRTLLRTPGLPAQAVLGLAAQLTQQVAPVGMVLVVHAATGSLGLAGLVVAGFSAGTALARPVQGRLIDRRGPRPVLIASGGLHVAALLALVLCAAAGTPGAVLVALGWAAGTGLPPVSQSMRVEWARRTPAQGRTTAYSLVYLTQELSILLGPLVFGAVVAVASASLALGLVAAAAGAGTLGYARVLRAGRPDGSGLGRRGGVFGPGMLLLLTVTALVGGAIGALDVGLPALAVARGRPAVAGVLVGVLSLGGILGAVAYGARVWAARPAARLVALLLGFGAALAPLIAIGSLPLIGVALLAAGITLNPALTTTSLLVDELAPRSPGEAFGWLSTAIGAGLAGGAALAGAIGQHYGPGRSLSLAAVSAFAAAALAAVFQWNDRPRRHEGPPHV